MKNILVYLTIATLVAMTSISRADGVPGGALEVVESLTWVQSNRTYSERSFNESGQVTGTMNATVFSKETPTPPFTNFAFYSANVIWSGQSARRHVWSSIYEGDPAGSSLYIYCFMSWQGPGYPTELRFYRQWQTSSGTTTTNWYGGDAALALATELGNWTIGLGPVSYYTKKSSDPSQIEISDRISQTVRYTINETQDIPAGYVEAWGTNVGYNTPGVGTLRKYRTLRPSSNGTFTDTLVLTGWAMTVGEKLEKYDDTELWYWVVPTPQ